MDEHDRPVADAVVDAATRKLRRLMDEATGAQHNSIAAKALEQFNRELGTDYAAANAQAEAEEIQRVQGNAVAALDAMPAEDETDDEIGDENDSAEHGDGSRSRTRRSRKR
jgi:hypothetical protein